MKLYDRAINQLASLEHVFGFDPSKVIQGSDDWRVMRFGCLTASKADKIVAGKDTDGRATYMAEIISDIINCASGDDSSFKQTEWGKLYEPEARDVLSVELGFVDIKEMPLIYMDESMRCAVSPDGVFDNTVCEIKAPYDGTNHVKHMAFDKVKPEWQWQRQFQLFGTGADQHVFCTYDPRVILSKNLHYTITDLDEKKQATLRDAVPQFIADLDAALLKLGVEFGAHWKYLKQNRSK